MSNISANQTIYLSTDLYGGVQPYDYCARWVGSYTASNGTTGLIPVNNSPGSGIPKITSSGICANPGVNAKGSLTGLFEPNGFTGTVDLWVYGKDASGIEDKSNVLTYGVLPIGSLVVNAGPDDTIDHTTGATLVWFRGATASGGNPPYTYQWSVPMGSNNPSATNIVNTTDLEPTVSGFQYDGVYSYQLRVTDQNGTSGTDIKTVTATGFGPLPSPPSADQILYYLARNPIGNNQTAFMNANLRVWNGLTGPQIGSVGLTGFGGAFVTQGTINGMTAGNNIEAEAQCTLFAGSGGSISTYQGNAYLTIRKQSRTFPYEESADSRLYIKKGLTGNASTSVRNRTSFGEFPPGVTGPEVFDPNYQYTIQGNIFINGDSSEPLLSGGGGGGGGGSIFQQPSGGNGGMTPDPYDDYSWISQGAGTEFGQP